jgi:hypothetical protein
MQDIEMLPDAETEFRRRLAMKLSERGYSGAALAGKVEELLRKGVKLKLEIDDITGA